MPSKLKRIVSGGQTGADRAAWDAAIGAGVETGGFVPAGRMAEDGPIPEKYPGVVETESDDTRERTRQNVTHSDGTIVISNGPAMGGTRLTVVFAEEHRKPYLHIDLSAVKQEAAIEEAARWIKENEIAVLNIAGPRASDDASIYKETFEFLQALFIEISGSEVNE